MQTGMFCTVHFKGNESEKEFDNAKNKKQKTTYPWCGRPVVVNKSGFSCEENNVRVSCLHKTSVI